MMKCSARRLGLASATAAAGVLLLCSSGCGGGGGTGGTAITQLLISIPTGSRLQTDARFALSAVAVISDGTRQTVQPRWQVDGNIGTVVGRVLETGSTPNIGRLIAAYEGLTEVVDLTTVAPVGLTGLRVRIGADFGAGPVRLTDRPPFYLVADDGTGPVYVSADAGSWSCVPAALGSLNSDGVFSPANDGVARIGAQRGGVAAEPASVTVVAPKVQVTARVMESGSLAAVSGVVVVFLNRAGVEVGRATSGTNGRWRASVSTTATHMYVESVPSEYYADWKYGGKVYDINYGPDTCKAPIPVPTEGLDLGTIFLFPISAGPPPPPDC